MSEAKLDSFFPIEHLKISGFSTPFRRDLDQYGAGLHDIVREDMPAKHLSSESTPIGGMYIKLNLHKKNWLLYCTYNPNHLKDHKPFRGSQKKFRSILYKIR